MIADADAPALVVTKKLPPDPIYTLTICTHCFLYSRADRPAYTWLSKLPIFEFSISVHRMGVMTTARFILISVSIMVVLMDSRNSPPSFQHKIQQ